MGKPPPHDDENGQIGSDAAPTEHDDETENAQLVDWTRLVQETD
jgi:hypothetical protein